MLRFLDRRACAEGNEVLRLELQCRSAILTGAKNLFLRLRACREWNEGKNSAKNIT
jgi:hypothetical protein